MFENKRPSKRVFAWRFALMVMFMLLLGGIWIAFLGRIDYRYSLGDKQVVGVIKSDESPVRFWVIVVSLISASTAGTIFTSIRHSGVMREENSRAEPIPRTDV
jgi:hypothetical protein